MNYWPLAIGVAITVGLVVAFLVSEWARHKRSLRSEDRPQDRADQRQHDDDEKRGKGH